MNLPTLITAMSVAVACAILSVFVISRRWAFIGEGISHSGLGGAGTAWALALIFPALDRPWVPYCGVVVFCIVTALLIGFFSRGKRINSDAAIGVFLVASVAWGIVAQGLYRNVHHTDPVGWDVFLFGRMTDLPTNFAIAAVGLSFAVIMTTLLLEKEIISYCFDPAMAEASGVRAGFIHYLLLMLIALTIVLGARIAGNILVSALLILPGTTAVLLSSRLRQILLIAVLVGLMGTIVGIAVSRHWRILPAGPMMVLTLFVEFVVAFAWSRVFGSRSGVAAAD